MKKGLLLSSMPPKSTNLPDYLIPDVIRAEAADEIIGDSLLIGNVPQGTSI